MLYRTISIHHRTAASVRESYRRDQVLQSFPHSPCARCARIPYFRRKVYPNHHEYVPRVSVHSPRWIVSTCSSIDDSEWSRSRARRRGSLRPTLRHRETETMRHCTVLATCEGISRLYSHANSARSNLPMYVLRVHVERPTRPSS